MSWNKNTFVMSKVDAVVDTLKKCGVDYKLTELDRVIGMGLNDNYGFVEALGRDGKYPIRRLAYNDLVVLEKMIRNPDCDGDDHIMSFEFKADEEPDDWECEEVMDDFISSESDDPVIESEID